QACCFLGSAYKTASTCSQRAAFRRSACWYAKASVLLHDTMRLSTAWSVELGTQYTTAYRPPRPPHHGLLAGPPPHLRLPGRRHCLAHTRRHARPHRRRRDTPAPPRRGLGHHRADDLPLRPRARYSTASATCASADRRRSHTRSSAPSVHLRVGVLMDEVLAVRGFPVACEKGLFDAEEAELLSVLRTGMGTMEIYAQGCPLIRESLKRSVSWVPIDGIQSINCIN
ncbi:hypothetical protein B0H14DRAFT_3785000, partial [Mycena olivaceomarginata]